MPEELAKFNKEFGDYIESTTNHNDIRTAALKERRVLLINIVTLEGVIIGSSLAFLQGHGNINPYIYIPLILYLLSMLVGVFNLYYSNEGDLILVADLDRISTAAFKKNLSGLTDPSLKEMLNSITESRSEIKINHPIAEFIFKRINSDQQMIFFYQLFFGATIILGIVIICFNN